MIPMEKWSKDHWSLLAYAETVCVDQQPLDRDQLRCNPLSHVMLQGWRQSTLPSSIVEGKYKYPTRLKGDEVVTGHDDWDVLDDLEAAGFLEVYSLVNGLIRMTTLGLRVVAQLREHKSNGGQFSEFSYTPPRPPAQTQVAAHG